MSEFTHLDKQGNAQMVDVSAKAESSREALAYAEVQLGQEAFDLLVNGTHKKGDVLAVARIAGIQAAKRTSDLIPLCHPLMLTKVNIDLAPNKLNNCIEIIALCKLVGQTGVEMEALTAASVAALTIYDMCKAVDKGICIKEVKLLKKTGGKSGHWQLEQKA